MNRFIKLLLFFISFKSTDHLIAQADTALGKVIYMEGKVMLRTKNNQSPVSINTLVYKNQSIITLTASVAEIEWHHGTKTTIEPASNYPINELYANSKLKINQQSESIFSGFKKIFRAAGESKRVEVAGIRRTKAITDTFSNPDQLDWVEDEEMTFEEASNYYEKGLYPKAVWALKTFLEQKPNDVMAAYATFALGHSYFMLNNTVKAKEVFERFKLQYAKETDLYNQAVELLKQL